MNLSSAGQTLQLIAWFLALTELVLALYTLMLNIRHTSNRHVGAMLLLFAINNFSIGLMIGATDASQAAWSTYLLAATSPAIQPELFLVTVVLLKTHWLRGRWRRVWWLLYGLVFLPVLLTLVDVGLGTRLWYTGLDAATYAGGYVSLFEYAAGSLSLPIKVLNFYASPVVAIVPLLYVALRDKEVTPLTRRLAWLLLGAQIVGTTVQMGLRGLLDPTVRVLVVGMAYVFAYAYAGFQQMISERRLQRGRLQTRLTAIVLVVTVPVLAAVVAFVSARAGALIEQAVVQQQEAELLSAVQQFRQVSWMVLAVGVLMLLALAWLTIRQALQPLGALTETVVAIAAGDLTRAAPVESEDEVGVLARAFNSMTGQLRGLISGLEGRVVERTADLERHAMQLQAAAEVARVAASVSNLDELLHQVVALVGERFDLYHVGLALLDETGRWAEYRAGTGEAGRLISEQGLRLEVGGASTVGWCTAHAQPRVAPDVSQETVYFEHPLLPDTRSEAALPLIARGRVIGALDVQSAEVGAFSQEDVTVLQTIADQIAIAIDNLRLFAEMQESLAEVQAIQRRYLREAWTGFTAARAPVLSYRYATGEVKSDPDAWLPAMTDAQRQEQAVITLDDDGATTFSLPITLRGETIGLLGFKKDSQGEWTDDDMAVAQAVADQVGLSLENVRLFDEAQHRAQHEALVRELSDRMRRTTDVETILKTAVQELGKALGSARTFVRLNVPAAE